MVETINHKNKVISTLRSEIKLDNSKIEDLDKQLAIKPDTVIKEVPKIVKIKSFKYMYCVDTVEVCHPIDTYAFIHDYFQKKPRVIKAIKINEDKVKE